MERKKNGFTLIELLATIVVLGIVVGIAIVTTGVSMTNAKKKSELVFVKTLEDALDMYIDSDAKELSYTKQVCTINKTHKNGVKVYKTESTVKFLDVVNSDYSPLVESEVVNPANKENRCSLNGTVTVYRDEDFVYYYKIAKSSFECLLYKEDSNGDEADYITNLPETCNE